jgi:6-phosphogluconolactonase
VAIFAVGPATGQLSLVGHQSTQGRGPRAFTIDPTSTLLLVANYETGSLCVLPIRKDGSLGEPTDTMQFSGSGPNPERQAGPHAHMVVPGPDASSMLAVDLGTDRLMAFRLDQERGTLSPAASPWTQLPPGAGPRHLAFHPHRPLAYVINELQSTITVCCYDGQQGEFAPFQTVSTLPDGFTGENLGAEIMVAPSGRFVYASNRGHDSVAIFAVGPATGQLSLVGHESTHGRGPRTFTIDPTGTLLLVANQDTDTVVTFWINQEAGTLRPTGRVAAVPTPVCLHLVSA